MPDERHLRSRTPAYSLPPRPHYAWSRRYATPGRWASYWHQIDEVLALTPATCLIVGKGDGTIEDALTRAGVLVTTVDIDPELEPDVVADVLDLPFDEGSFDVVLAAQVLEHLPFDSFSRALRELSRVTRGPAILSLPQTGHQIAVQIALPYLPALRLFAVLPARSRWRGVSRKGHHWAIGARNYRRRGIEDVIRAFFVIERTYTVTAHPGHRFYVLLRTRERNRDRKRSVSAIARDEHERALISRRG